MARDWDRERAREGTTCPFGQSGAANLFKEECCPSAAPPKSHTHILKRPARVSRCCQCCPIPAPSGQYCLSSRIGACTREPRAEKSERCRRSDFHSLLRTAHFIVQFPCRSPSTKLRLKKGNVCGKTRGKGSFCRCAKWLCGVCGMAKEASRVAFSEQKASGEPAPPAPVVEAASNPLPQTGLGAKNYFTTTTGYIAVLPFTVSLHRYDPVERCEASIGTLCRPAD